MTASETVNPKEKLGGPLGRAEERHRPGSMGATSPPPPRFFYLLCSASCGILVPHQGLNPCPLHWEHKSLNHWTTREVSERTMFKVMFKAN